MSSPEPSDEQLYAYSDEVGGDLLSHTPWRVLAVDDDADFQDAIAFSLKDAILLDRPIELVQAFSMADAVQILAKKTEFSVVLVDVVMETEDAGLRLVRAIREMLGFLDTRIILLTGQPGFAPIDSVMSRYDLSDYCLKSDIHRRGIKNLLMGSLRAYRDISAINFARRSLNLILETSNRLVTKRNDFEPPQHAPPDEADHAQLVAGQSVDDGVTLGREIVHEITLMTCADWRGG